MYPSKDYVIETCSAQETSSSMIVFKLFRALNKHEEFEETKEVPREGVKEIETSQSHANTTTSSIVMLPL